MKLFKFLSFIFALFVFIEDAHANAAYTLDSGDKVKVTVFQEEDLSGEFEVSAEGELSLPLIGSVFAKGQTLKQVEQSIINMLLDGFLKSPRVSLEVLNYRPFYILGEVNEPGSYPYVNGMTALNAVALGGGFTYRADKDDLLLIKANDSSKKPRKITPETKIFPGDVVRVEERLF
ncbi:polysaccharide biosynthesis/export family protein [Terasakiella sp. A23]|uniref:polysaccharide biosynthesis/export family protein n=1 Tax=Terasakiella sp. FCG-A23 TaxID=3080561 RepID=UPI0029535295|nr:polysaccharide biosynthesis/export family protein [Terasakiella sp. A23]MDV7339292.1 polysaccharide biosynthesis/export family protein [Terasakiella sp. A23]